MIGAGELDRRIQFQRYTMTDDGFSQVEAWAVHGSPVWASKQDVSDGERMRASEVSAFLNARFVVRSSVFSRGLTAKDRLTYGTTTFAIFGIKEIGRNNMLEITAGAEVSNGDN
jgi:SPP1 family predicted phage head-tail adaptor